MQIANITMNNGLAVATTFNPMMKDGLLVTYANTTPPKSSLYPVLTASMRPAKGDVSRKVTLKVMVPYESTALNGTVSVEAVTAFIELVIPSSAPTTAKDDIIAFASGYIKESQVVDAVKNGAFPY